MLKHLTLNNIPQFLSRKVHLLVSRVITSPLHSNYRHEYKTVIGDVEPSDSKKKHCPQCMFHTNSVLPCRNYYWKQIGPTSIPNSWPSPPISETAMSTIGSLEANVVSTSKTFLCHLLSFNLQSSLLMRLIRLV